MSFITEITDRVTAALSSFDGLEGVRVVNEYTAEKKTEPLAFPVIGVGFYSVETSAGATVPCDNGTAYRCTAVIKVSINIPHRFEGEECYRIMGEAVQALLGIPGISFVKSGEMRHERTCGALVIDLSVAFSGMLAVSGNSACPQIKDIKIKGEKSYVRKN